jgi:uncharacterized protein
MKEDLLKLLEVQEVDFKIDVLVKSRNEYPAQIDALMKEINDLKESIKEIESGIVETSKNRGEIEIEIGAERENLTNKEKRLLETKTNKEYNAVQSEIEQARARIDALETEELENMSRLETLEPRSVQIAEQYTVTVAGNTSKAAELKSYLDSVEANVTKLVHTRNVILAGINKRLVSVYTRLRKGKDGMAIATVNKAKFSCRGCHKHLPPQKVMEIRRGNAIISCENCGRILVWDEREEN